MIIFSFWTSLFQRQKILLLNVPLSWVQSTAVKALLASSVNASEAFRNLGFAFWQWPHPKGIRRFTIDCRSTEIDPEHLQNWREFLRLKPRVDKDCEAVVYFSWYLHGAKNITNTCSVSDKKDSKFAEVKIFNPSDSSFSVSVPFVSSGTVSTPLMLKRTEGLDDAPEGKLDIFQFLLLTQNALLCC